MSDRLHALTDKTALPPLEGEVILTDEQRIRAIFGRLEGFSPAELHTLRHQARIQLFNRPECDIVVSILTCAIYKQLEEAKHLFDDVGRKEGESVGILS